MGQIAGISVDVIVSIVNFNPSSISYISGLPVGDIPGWPR